MPSRRGCSKGVVHSGDPGRRALRAALSFKGEDGTAVLRYIRSLKI
jgi:hypothetical protein